MSITLYPLQANTSLKTLIIKECGFRVHEMNEIERYVSERHSKSSASLVNAVQFKTFFADIGATKYTFDHLAVVKRLCMPRAAYDSKYNQWKDMSWIDQLKFSRVVAGERTRLEKLRADEENFIRDVRFAPPPVPRQTLPSRSKAVMFGAGVTNVKKYSDKVKDEKATDNGKMAFLAEGETITATYHIPENLTSIFINELKEAEVCID